LAEEKDFCTLLSEQIIDEKQAVELYQRLLDLFEEEKELLLPGLKEELAKPSYPKPLVGEMAVTMARIQEIIENESEHAKTLEERRKILCEVKE